MKYKIRTHFLVISSLLALSFFLSFTGYAQTPATQQFVIKNVNVIPMTSPNTVLYNATIIISGDKIAPVNTTVSKDATIIDGKGKWLIPGLIDMHVHVTTDTYFGIKLPTQVPDIMFNTQDIMTPFIANGVTTVLDLNATMETFSEKKEIEKGNVIGPRIALAALINGGEGSGRIANTAADGRQTVRTAKAEGYDFIKLYSKLNIETYDAIVDEAYIQGLKTVGHIPDAFQGKIEQAFVPHFGMVAHAEELAKKSADFSSGDARHFAQLAKANGTWLTATLTAMEWIANQSHSLDRLKASPTLQYVHPLLQSKWLTANSYNKNATPERAAYFDSVVQFNFLLVKAFKEAGVPIVAGTDAGVSGVVAGFALHDELALLVQAGLTPEEALNAATLSAARWLGIDQQIGTVETGKFADLVLLDENPLADINNTRKIAGVFVNGKWLSKTTINTMLSGLAKRNTADKNKFDWQTITNKKKLSINR